jgi:hypothetical protein
MLEHIARYESQMDLMFLGELTSNRIATDQAFCLRGINKKYHDETKDSDKMAKMLAYNKSK